MISLYKMAAPLVGHGISKQTVNRLIATNLLLCSVLFSLIYIPANTQGPLDVIHNVLPLTLGYCGIIAFSQILFWFSSKQNQHLKVQNILQGAALFAGGCLLFHVIAVLYGAPFTEATSETFHLALLLSTTSVLPACVILGPHLLSWSRVFAQNNPDLGAESVIHMASICSVVGAWLGAFPIPLDWDRPWQVWPISCVLGTLVGYCVGLLVSAVHLYHKYRILSKMKLT